MLNSGHGAAHEGPFRRGRVVGKRLLGVVSAGCCLLFFVIGCDSKPNTGAVTGVVTFEGKPVTEGTVTFYPSEGGRPAIGHLGSDGAFTLTTFQVNDGALLGEHKVTIEAKQVTNVPPPPKSLAEEVSQASAPRARAKVKWLVPEKYADQTNSGLTATVTDGANQIDFDLP